jgi:hypothetical protein
MDEHVAVPGAALHWQRLRLKNGRSLAESGTQLVAAYSRAASRSAYAWSKRSYASAPRRRTRLMEPLQAAAKADAVRARGKGE